MLPRIKRKIFDFAKMDPVLYEYEIPSGNTVNELRQALINGYFNRQPTLLGRGVVTAYLAARRVARYTIKPMLRAIGK